MTPSPLSRRDLLRRGAGAALAGSLVTAPSFARADPSTFSLLESRHRARLGVWAVNHRTGASLAWRADERFPFCSAYKGLLAAHVLRHRLALDRVVHYTKADLIEGDLVTGALVEMGMTVRALCAAAIAYSDNTAANLLFGLTGGPSGLTRYARSLGDSVTRSDRTEPTLNLWSDGETHDTTSPRAIGDDYTRLLLGNALPAAQRTQLRFWMEGDAVNVKRFRAGLPEGWLIADKTGTGFTRFANDVGVAWTPRGTPLTISVLTAKDVAHAAPDDALVAAAAGVVARELAPGQ